NATKIAKILNDIFVGRSGTNAETPTNQLAPGTNATASRLDALSAGGAGAPAGGASSSSTSTPAGQSAGSESNSRTSISTAFGPFAERWNPILPHSRMPPSRVIVASFKCSPTLPSAEPALQGGDGLDPPSDRLRGRRRAHTLILTPHATGFPAAESASHRPP